MLDGYHILTLTHRDAPLDCIGKLIAPLDERSSSMPFLAWLKSEMGWEEIYYIATCNRVIYLYYAASPQAPETVQKLLGLLNPHLPTTQQDDLSARIQWMHGAEAIRHFIAVAASMDSLVVGEREIIRQMREAYDFCRAAGLSGDHLRLLMRFTIETAKTIYAQTAIGEKALSVVALAFQAMRNKGIGPESRVLLVGAGRTNSLFAKFLSKYGYKHIAVFNRSLKKAEDLAGECGGMAYPLDRLENYSDCFDVLVVCTSATEAFITIPVYQQLLAGDTSPKVVVDLAVPQNTAIEVLETYPVHYISVESLRQAAAENLAHRQRECEKAALVIDSRLPLFREQWHERQIERALAHIPDEVRAVKERALYEVYGKAFTELDENARQVVLDMLNYMEKKCVAIPMKAAKAIALHAGKNREKQIKPSSA
jgi:glutamyl-tRNA reductase